MKTTRIAPLMVRVDVQTKKVISDYAALRGGNLSTVFHELIAENLAKMLLALRANEPDIHTEPTKAEDIDDDWTPGKGIIEDLAERLIKHDFGGASRDGVIREFSVQLAAAMKREDARAEAEAKADEPTAEATADADKA
jgi:hypothetical protein